MAHVLLRLWVGFRLFFAGVDKFREKGGTGITVANLEKNLAPIADLMRTNSLLPSSMITPYFYALTAGLILVGITSILGLATRFSLFLAGLIFLSLSMGMMTLPDDNTAVTIGLQVAIAAMALVTFTPNKFSVDGLFGGTCCQKPEAKPE
jgi:uncharacterized membrane protein YphA (DoxX/SURF4 family)